ncbi:hypothetical protein EFP84_05665 [Leptospira kmetyi]|uniref:Uncharacterized protein n=1 Tax=Leptospira kmetyi TaxID=408139 RepID=A0AAD0XN60_9LEPT|nr:hypothetical protein EFP84_05665 [Leptospira kmetyi]
MSSFDLGDSPLPEGCAPPEEGCCPAPPEPEVGGPPACEPCVPGDAPGGETGISFPRSPRTLDPPPPGPPPGPPPEEDFPEPDSPSFGAGLSLKRV